MEVIEHPIQIRDPQDQNDHHQTVQDRFDLSLHRDEPVDNPQQETCSDNCHDDSGKWHIVFSNHFSDLMPRLALSGSYERLAHSAWGAIGKRRTMA
jgi:hypothetical protein